jgi:hypothetical protein
MRSFTPTVVKPHWTHLICISADLSVRTTRLINWFAESIILIPYAALSLEQQLAISDN